MVISPPVAACSPTAQTAEPAHEHVVGYRGGWTDQGPFVLAEDARGRRRALAGDARALRWGAPASACHPLARALLSDVLRGPVPFAAVERLAEDGLARLPRAGFHLRVQDVVRLARLEPAATRGSVATAPVAEGRAR